METVEHDGRTTAFRVANRGTSDRTLLFIHGSGADHRVWKAQDRLARDHRVVSIDLSGHGDSADIETEIGPPTLDAYVADVAAVADETDADVLVGNSLGGAVVQWALLEEAVSVDGAVLVGTGAKLAVLEQLRTWLAEDFDRAVDFLHEPDRLFSESVDERLVRASREAMYDCGRAVTERDFLTCHHFDVREDIDEIEVPILVIGGERDGLTPPAYHEFIAETVNDGSVTIMADAAHLVMLERPEAFNEAVSSFVQRLD